MVEGGMDVSYGHAMYHELMRQNSREDVLYIIKQR